ncbi:hypothetical protein T11_12951 [Trichinella zimbabwensis]|uniref:Uncharacterized protein n=1 Tax=Trichinella zimbabwensis TaxID=268475 RepID=A0A0V1HPZ4_9BILA|nr:hypothetical protein T11_12951 [Trichinella zimbabwensis]
MIEARNAYMKFMHSKLLYLNNLKLGVVDDDGFMVMWCDQFQLDCDDERFSTNSCCLEIFSN